MLLEMQLLLQWLADISNQVQQEVQDQIITQDIIIQLGLGFLHQALIRLELIQEDIMILQEAGFLLLLELQQKDILMFLQQDRMFLQEVIIVLELMIQLRELIQEDIIQADIRVEEDMMQQEIMLEENMEDILQLEHILVEIIILLELMQPVVIRQGLMIQRQELIIIQADIIQRREQEQDMLTTLQQEHGHQAEVIREDILQLELIHIQEELMMQLRELIQEELLEDPLEQELMIQRRELTLILEELQQIQLELPGHKVLMGHGHLVEEQLVGLEHIQEEIPAVELIQEGEILVVEEARVEIVEALEEETAVEQLAE